MAKFTLYELEAPPVTGKPLVEALPRAKPRNANATSKRVGVSKDRGTGYWIAQLTYQGKTRSKACLTEAEATAWRERFEYQVYGKFGGATPVRGRKVSKEYMLVRAICDDNIVRMARQTGPAEEWTIPAIVKAVPNVGVSGFLYIDSTNHVWRFRAHRDGKNAFALIPGEEGEADRAPTPGEAMHSLTPATEAELAAQQEEGYDT